MWSPPDDPEWGVSPNNVLGIFPGDERHPASKVSKYSDVI
jgi:hypothetical protein